MEIAAISEKLGLEKSLALELPPKLFISVVQLVMPRYVACFHASWVLP
jgi:hypothetical protein